MSRTPVLFALASILVLSLVAVANANVTPETTTITWSIADWDSNTATGIPLLTLDDLVWQDGTVLRQLTGSAPCVGDPDVHEVTTNRTRLVWTDWHVTITNGTIDAATVRKVGGLSWLVTIAADGSGFDAFSTQPVTRISPGERLDIWFRYTSSGDDDVLIDEYPSTETPSVPEPSSLLAMASALLALGLGRIKRMLGGCRIRRITRYAVAAIGALLLLQACAMSAVTVTWAGGSVDLSLIANPDVNREPWCPQVWYGELPISMADLNPVVLTGTGNFNNLGGTTVDMIRLKQVVTNNTNCNWTDFHVALDGGYFYKKWLIQSGWSVDLSDTQMDFYANNNRWVLPGGKFSDGIEFNVLAGSSGDGTFTLTKWPSVPEPASALALLTGLAGLFSFVVRRRA